MKIRPVSVIITTITEQTANIYDGNSRNKTTAVSRTTANPVAEKAMIKKPFHLEVLTMVACDL